MKATNLIGFAFTSTNTCDVVGRWLSISYKYIRNISYKYK